MEIQRKETHKPTDSDFMATFQRDSVRQLSSDFHGDLRRMLEQYFIRLYALSNAKQTMSRH